MNARKHYWFTLLCAAGLSVTACGDDDDKTPETPADDSGTPSKNDAGSSGMGNSDAGTSPDAGGDDAGEPAKPTTYAIATQVFGASDQTTYLVLHEGKLFGEEEIGIEGGVERAGRGLAVAGKMAGSVYYAGDKSADVNLYLAKDGSLEEEDALSFAGEGLASIGEYPGQLVMVSETKALYFDARTLKVMVWNPKAMTLDDAIDVSDLAVPDFSPTFSTTTFRKGDKVYMPVAYRTPASVPSSSAMLIVDTETDSATIVKDTRCGYVRDAAVGDDGMLYLATEAFGSAVHYLNDTVAPPPCLLRFDMDAQEYDAGFKVELNALADGKPVGSLVALPNGKVYTRVLDEAAVPAMDMPSGRAVASARAWGWSEITLGDEPKLTAVEDAYVMGGSLVPQPLADDLVIPDFAADLSSTTLCNMKDGPFCEENTKVQGLVFSVALVED